MLRVFFAGTPDCAIPALKALAARHTVCGVLTAPPAPAGRSKKKLPSPVFSAVEALKTQHILDAAVPVFMPEKLDADFRASVKALTPDVLVCFAFGKIFGPKTLALFPQGALNIHPSLLPRWRGPSPVPAAIAAGDTITGVTVQYMAAQMDAGDIIVQQKTAVELHDTTETLIARCAGIGAEIILQALEQVENNCVHAVPQNGSQATYCKLLQKEYGCINWQESAAGINNKIRAYTPWPVCYTHWNSVKLNILEASVYNGSRTAAGSKAGTVIGKDSSQGILIQTGTGILAVTKLQRETKKAMYWKDFLNGAAEFIGSCVE